MLQGIPFLYNKNITALNHHIGTLANHQHAGTPLVHIKSQCVTILNTDVPVPPCFFHLIVILTQKHLFR